MILFRTQSQFLRALRALSPDTLPALPEKPLSKRQQKRLEKMVAERIHGKNDAPQTSVQNEEIFIAQPVDNRKNWGSVILAACLFLMVASLGVYFRGDIGMFFTTLTEMDTAASDTVITETDEIIYPPLENESEELTLTVEDVTAAEDGGLQLALCLTSQIGMLDGISVQYDRVILELWDENVKTWRTKYDVYRNDHDDFAEIMAGDVLFFLGNEPTESVSSLLTIPYDAYSYPGTWRVSLSGVTLVRDAAEGEDGGTNDMISEPLTDGFVSAIFETDQVTSPQANEVETGEVSYTVPEDALELSNPAESLSLSYDRLTSGKDDTQSVIDLRLSKTDGEWNGDAIYYKSYTLEYLKPADGEWLLIDSMDYDAVNPVLMLVAGDMHFFFNRERTVSECTMSMPVQTPYSGIYRLTLNEFRLVRTAEDGEEGTYDMVSEVIEDGSAVIIFEHVY